MNSAKPILVLAEPLDFPSQARLQLERHFELVEGPFSRQELLDAVRHAAVLFVRLSHRIDDELFSHAPKLTAVASATTALIHIDEEAARKRGIAIISLRGQRTFLDGIYATAEHTFALILAVIRRIPFAHLSVCAGDWKRDLFRGSELNGRTLGVIGFGRLGSKVATYARAFEMDIVAYDQTAKIPSWAKGCSLDELCRSADIVSLHATASAENNNMIGAQHFSAMRRGAIFINTARGELVDEAALLDALRFGRLGGAALDVLKMENSQDPADIAHALELKTYARMHENLVLTPHLGGSTLKMIQKTETFLSKCLLGALCPQSAAWTLCDEPK